MKKNTSTTLLAALLIELGLSSLLGQSYSIDRFAIAGGGGTSTGGNFTLNGTLGQPDAGTMSGGNYSLAGGFWGASQTPPPAGSVIIKVWLVGGQVRLRFTGIPGRTYDIERASSVTGPWRPNNQPFATITMPIDGVAEFVDTTGLTSPQSFYRTSTP